jgi:hypothetical protein
MRDKHIHATTKEQNECDDLEQQTTEKDKKD